MDIKKIMQEMTLEEKAGLCSGADFWYTKAVERLGVPAVMVTDGPHGLRKQEEQADHLGIAESVKAVCFPAGCALASSFDRDLIGEVGTYLGEEARAEKVHTLLGPAVNIKRSPLCGRNFEYLSEDPYLAGEMAASYVQGVQSQKVGTSVKHFAANNQETRRMSVSDRVDERTLREIYLTAFEKIVKQAKPWTLMCSYNQINGVYSCENDWLLNQVLRREWGFDGIVMTDWGAMNRRCEALEAGLNLEMPSSNGRNDAKIVEAVKNGSLKMETLDKAVEGLLEWINKGLDDKARTGSYDKGKHHRLACRAAEESAVLLKNKNGLLPLNQADKIAFIGRFAESPRYQGGGSSHINSFRVDSALDAAKNSGLSGITYAPGYEADGATTSPELLQAALKAAKEAKAAVIFAGLPDSYESEGYDRTTLDLPACQNELIEKVCEVQPNTVVVLHNGSAVSMPWIEKAASVLEMYLGGQAVGTAEIRLLFGKANPSGKLAETFPLRLEDTPAYLNFPGSENEVSYGEGVYVGYRWYDARKMQVLFPFGHGLSYTTFALSNLKLSSGAINDTDPLTASVTVKNTGKVAGKETVQLYVTPPENQKSIRPVRELKGFQKVSLQPGEEKTISFSLDKRSFAYYETRIPGWYTGDGEYEIFVGTSSRDLPLHGKVKISSTERIPLKITDTTTMGDVLRYGKQPELLEPVMEKMRKAFGMSPEAVNSEMFRQMIDGMPLHSIASFFSEDVEELEKTLR